MELDLRYLVKGFSNGIFLELLAFINISQIINHRIDLNKRIRLIFLHAI